MTPAGIFLFDDELATRHLPAALNVGDIDSVRDMLWPFNDVFAMPNDGLLNESSSIDVGNEPAKQIKDDCLYSRLQYSQQLLKR
jgi:hypothetical protein